MSGLPTFVIGTGAAGIDVVCRLSDRQGGDHIGYLAVDADRETLDRTPGDVPDIHLGSRSGVVGEGLGSYPFLARDETIPEDGTNRQRHIGRYKLDNPDSPGFASHYEELRSRLRQFYEKRRASLDEGGTQYAVVLVGSLAGGTGSGTVPLLSAMLTHIGTHVMSADVWLLGVGIVPPLAVDPGYAAPPAEPVAYPNTYGALRNLATLLGARENTVQVPVYSAAGLFEERGAAGSPLTGDPGVVFEVDDPPFDSYWLVSTAHGFGPETQQELPAMIGDGIHALTAHASPGADAGLRSRTGDTSPLGTVGYAAVEVPHRLLRRFCERKRERERVQDRLESVVEPKIEELRGARDELVSVLDTRVDSQPQELSGRLEAIRARIDGERDFDGGFVERTTPDEVESVLADVATDAKPQSYLLASLALRWALTEGPVGSEVRSDAEETWAGIRDGYDFELVPRRGRRSQPLDVRLDALIGALTDRLERCRKRRSEAGLEVRDVLPPTREAFTSERERLSGTIDRLEADREEVRRMADRLDALRALEDVATRHVDAARESVRSRLERVTADLAHFRRERDEAVARIDELERELGTLRETLTHPEEEDGPVFALPLARDALDDVTVADLETTLTSLAAYAEEGLLGADEATIPDSLERGYEYSRSWPEAISRHSVAVDASASHDETLVLFHRENEPHAGAFVESLTGPNTLYTSSESALAYTDDPYRIELVSVSQGGRPESLVGFQRLEGMAEDDTLEALAGPYRDYRRALAYPEWYGPAVRDAFEQGPD